MGRSLIYDKFSPPVRRCCCLSFSNAVMIFSKIAGDAAAFLICCRLCNGSQFQKRHCMGVMRPTNLD
jgi:hypothetical protein